MHPALSRQMVHQITEERVRTASLLRPAPRTARPDRGLSASRKRPI
jgi:hypothetical protein